ncbi:unnamed protein product [Lactuca saligna]|uniref:Uncharacterized protein n=1 Tax=Lactuca saligna TaxID=75948 RepID=A0AA35VSM9_LACSI|nr:unnamed protein product [Lactuca saligna]
MSIRLKYTNYLQIKDVLNSNAYDATKAIQAIYSLKRQTETIIEDLKKNSKSDKIKTMKLIISIVPTTYTTIVNMRQELLKQSPTFLPYNHYVITEELIKDMNKETTLMMDSFEAIQDKFNATMEAYAKIVKDLPYI